MINVYSGLRQIFQLILSYCNEVSGDKEGILFVAFSTQCSKEIFCGLVYAMEFSIIFIIYNFADFVHFKRVLKGFYRMLCYKIGPLHNEPM